MENKSKNIVLLIISTVALLVIIGGAVYSLFFNKGFMNKFNKYYNRNENTIIYYASSQCGYCAMQTPILETLAKQYDLDYLEIDSIKLTTSERNTVLEKLGIEHATPTTVVVKNGKIVGFNEGTVPSQEKFVALTDDEIKELKDKLSDMFSQVSSFICTDTGC